MIAIPAWITDLASFRQWACSDQYPERGCISYFKGYLWVDLSFENIAHNRAKVVIIAKLDRLTKDVGSVHLGGMRLTHPEADFSTEPDGMYISYEAIKN